METYLDTANSLLEIIFNEAKSGKYSSYEELVKEGKIINDVIRGFKRINTQR